MIAKRINSLNAVNFMQALRSEAISCLGTTRRQGSDRGEPITQIGREYKI